MTFLNACRNGQKGIVQIFLKKGGIDVNKRDAEGNTPLYYACLKGFRDIVNLLLDNDADVFVFNNLSETPLHAASRSGNKEIIGKLVQYGAELDATDNEGRTPLIRLLENRRTDTAMFLIEQGADTEIADNTGHKAIDYATAHGLREVVERLSTGSTADTHGNTPLHQAAFNGQSEIVRSLLSTFPDMTDATNDDGETPLIIACMKGNLAVAKLLLDAGADANRSQLNGCKQEPAERKQPSAFCRMVRKQVHRQRPDSGTCTGRCAERERGNAPDPCRQRRKQRVCLSPCRAWGGRKPCGQSPAYGIVLCQRTGL